MAFIDYKQELSGTIPGLSSLYAGTLLNRVFRRICDARYWSWLKVEDEFVAPSPISEGTVQVTQFSTFVIPDTTAGPLIIAAIHGNPPLIDRQFRCSTGGAIYNIAAVNPSTGVLTLDRPYGEQTSTGISYSIYRCYYAPPAADFWKYNSILNPQQGYTISGERLRLTGEELDRRDPLRASYGDAHYIASYKSTAATGSAGGLPISEFWEHPTNPCTYVVRYHRRGSAMMLDTDDIPASLNPDLLMEGAHALACMWANANQGRNKELKGVNWLQTAKGHAGEYAKLLQRAKVKDQDLDLTDWIDAESQYRLSGPIDGAYAQAHDLTFF